jgi:hypothetical protein
MGDGHLSYFQFEAIIKVVKNFRCKSLHDYVFLFLLGNNEGWSLGVIRLA